MTTLCRSKSSVASYSMETKDSPARDGGPAVDGQRHLALVAGGVTPFEDAEGRARGEGSVGILQAEHALRGVQRLVDVGVGLELEALVGPGGDADADERILLPAPDLEHHRALQLHLLQPAVLLHHAVNLFLDLQRDALHGHRGHPRRGGGTPEGRLQLHSLALRAKALQKLVLLSLPAEHQALRGTRARGRGGGVASAARATAQVHAAHAAVTPGAARAVVETVVEAPADAHPAHPAAIVKATADADAAHAAAAVSAAAAAPVPIELSLLDLHRLALHHVLRVVDLALDDHLMQLLLVRLHLRESAHLAQRHVLFVA